MTKSILILGGSSDIGTDLTKRLLAKNFIIKAHYSNNDKYLKKINSKKLKLIKLNFEKLNSNNAERLIKNKFTFKYDIIINLVGYVDQFVETTKTFGANMTARELKKADTAALAKADADEKERKKRGDFFDKTNLKADGTPKKGSDAAQGLEQGISVADTKEEFLKQGNVYAQNILKEQDALKKDINDAFKVAFQNKLVARDFAYEAMAGWEKFGARTFPKMGGGQDIGRADALLVWDYDMAKIKYQTITSRNSKAVTHAAKAMKMSADMKSGSYSSGGSKFGYSLYQTVRLNVELALDEQDGLNEEFDSKVERYQELLSEGWWNEGKFLDMFKKAWNWFKEKVKAVWTKLVEAIVALKNKIVEMVGKGTEALMGFCEVDVDVRVNPTVKF